MKKFIAGICIFSLFVLFIYAQNALHVNAAGNVGIGTENPTEKLEVNGRIKDKTGYVMPVGTILPYGGSIVPDGWLFCDGTTYDGSSGSEYKELFDVVGTAFGSSGTSFSVPDLRGIFPRGAGTSGTLTAANGAAFSAALGAYQNDGFQGYRRKVYGTNDTASSGDYRNYLGDASRAAGRTPDFNGIPGGWGGGNFCAGTWGTYLEDGYGPPRVTSETRPANVAVNFIIKY